MNFVNLIELGELYLKLFDFPYSTIRNISSESKRAVFKNFRRKVLHRVITKRFRFEEYIERVCDWRGSLFGGWIEFADSSKKILWIRNKNKIVECVRKWTSFVSRKFLPKIMRSRKQNVNWKISENVRICTKSLKIIEYSSLLGFSWNTRNLPKMPEYCRSDLRSPNVCISLKMRRISLKCSEIHRNYPNISENSRIHPKWVTKFLIFLKLKRNESFR